MFPDLYVLHMAVGCLAGVIGVPGNITIIVVFARLGIKNATDITLIALAIVDLAASIINAMKILLVFIHDDYPWVCFYEVIAARSALYAALFLTICVAFYRFQAVCKPFDRRIGRRAAIAIAFGCTILAFGIHIPFFFITKSIKVREGYSCSAYGNVSWGRDVYAKTQAFIFFASAVSIAILNLRMYKFIRASQIIRQQMIAGAAFTGQEQAKHIDIAGSLKRSIPSVSSRVSANVGTEPVETNNQNPKDCQSSARPRAIPHPVNGKVKLSSKKLRRIKLDHKTTQVVLIVTIIFFLLWLPNIVIDQIPNDQIILDTDKGSFIIYFFDQIKYTSHIINVFVYISIFRRFRQKFCHPFN